MAERDEPGAPGEAPAAPGEAPAAAPERRIADRIARVTALPKDLGVKVGMLIAFTIVVAAAFVLYVLFARGVFENTQRLVLLTDNSEGVSIGMDLAYSGFPVGRVRRIELGKDGKVRIEIDIPRKDARWLRASSVFTLERGLVGGARLRAFTGNLDDVALPDDAVRQVLRGDSSEEVPRLVATMKTILENVERMTAADSSINASLGSMRTLAERMAGRQGILGAALGGEENANKVIATIDRANALLATLGGATLKLDRTLASADRLLGTADQSLAGANRAIGRAEEKVLGAGGVLDEAQKAIVQLNAVLGDVRGSLKKADAVLAEAQKIGANTAVATEDLAGLRAEVEASLRRAAQLIEEINRKWPFARDAELKLR